MRKNLGLAVLAAAILLAGCTSPASPAAVNAGTPPAPPSEALEAVPLVSHVQFGVFEQDVYVAGARAGEVVRPTPADAAAAATADAPLYTTAQVTDHDPTFQNVGPFAAGHALAPNGAPITLRSWLAASGSAAYLCTGGTTARVDATFAKLVPNGVYTLWNTRLVFRDGAIVGANDIPAGAADGSQNRFRADAQGSAHVAITWDGCTAPATGGPAAGAPTGEGSLFAIAYHSDGQTYGANPGPFGQHTHVQLFGLYKAAR